MLNSENIECRLGWGKWKRDRNESSNIVYEESQEAWWWCCWTLLSRTENIVGNMYF